MPPSSDQLASGPFASSPQAGAPPPPEESTWRVGTLSYTKAGLISVFSWLLWGDLAWSIRDRSLQTILQLLLKKFEASDTVAGLLLGTIPSAIGLILGPIISFRSDRYRSPRGRRLPFLLASAPVAALSIIGLGFSPVLGRLLHDALGTHSPGLFPSVLIVLGIWWVIFDVATTFTNAVFGALINDVVPHGVLGRFFGMFRAVSLVVGIIFNFWLLAKAEDHYQWMFAAVGTVYGVGVVWMCLKVREGEYPPPAPLAEGSAPLRFLLAAREYFRQAYSKPYYIWFFVASNLAPMALSPVNTFSLFFAKSVNMDTATYGKYLACTYTISLCTTYLMGTLVDRFHPLRATMVAIGLYGLATVWGGIYAVSAGTFGVAFLLHGVFAGVFNTVSASLGQRILPQANFAQFGSASGLIGAALSLILPPTLGYFLDIGHHDYRLTFLTSSVLSFVALGCFVVVYGGWRRLGGPHHYVAPV